MKDILGVHELKSPVFWRDVLTEIIGSMILLTFLTSTMVEYSPDFNITPTHAGMAVGLAVCGLVETFGHISGCHINPAVTLAMVIKRQTSIIRGVLYTIAQCVGGAAGSGLVYGLTAPDHRSLLHPLLPAPELGPLRGMCVEIVLTFVFISVVLGVTDPTRPNRCTIPGIPVGFTVTANIITGATYTGAAFNPIIAFGPAIITRNFKHHWVYWAGPYMGATAAVILYSLLTLIGKYFGTPAETEKGTVEQSDNLDEVLQLLQDMRRREAGNNNEKKQDTGAI